MSLKGQVARSALWSGIQIAGNQATSFAVFLVLTHFLSPAEIGLAALAMSLIEVVSPLMRAGLPEALIQSAELREIDADTCFWSSLALSGVLAAAMVALAPILSHGFASPALAPVIVVLSSLLPLSALSATHEARVTRAFGFKMLAVRTLVGNLLGGAVGVAMAVEGFGVWSLVAQRLVASAAGVALIWATYRWMPRPRFSMSAVRRLSRFGMHMTIVNFLTSLNSRIFDFLLGFFMGPSAVGYVRVASRCMDMVTQFAVNPLTSVMLPALSRLQGDGEAFGRAFRRMAQACAFLTFPAFFGLALIAPDVVPLAFGARWALSGHLLVILCLSAVPITLQSLIWPALAAAGHSDQAARAILVIVVSATLFTSFAAPFGLHAVIVMHVVRTYATLPISLLLLRRHTGIRSRPLLAIVAAPFAAAAAMVAILAPSLPLWAPLSPVTRVACLIFAGLGLYAVLTFRSSFLLVRELRGTFKLG